MKELISLAADRGIKAEVYRVAEDIIPVSFTADRLKSVESRKSLGAGIRVVADGKIGSTSTTLLDEPEKALSAALASAEFGAAADFEFAGKAEYPEVLCYDQALSDMGAEEMVRLGERIVEIVKGEFPESKTDVGMRKTTREVSIDTTEGFSGAFRSTLLSVSAHATLAREGDMLLVWSELTARRAADVNVEEVAREIVRLLRLSGTIVDITPGTMPVVFTSRAAYALMLSLEQALNGRMVLHGASPFKGRLGEKVLDEKITVYDDPLLPYGTNTRPFDDEGTPCRTKTLIDRGAVASFYYDRRTAAKAGVEPTGNAARGGFEGQPQPAASNLILAPGEASLDEIISSIDSGLVVEQVLGAGQGNILAGEFSVNVHLGFKIEKGRIAGRVKNVMVTGNVFEVLGKVLALGNDARWTPYDRVKAPSIALEAVSVTSK